MARTYTHTPVLSSQKLGETKYYLKDADARTILDSINDDVFASLTQALGTVAGNDSKLVTAANIKSYVDQAVAVGIQIVVVETLPEASAQTKGKIYLVADTHAAGDVYDEFITIENPTGTFTWEKIGNTDIDLSGYVQKTTTIAGIDLQDNITKAELQSALELGNMAYVNQGTFTVADYVNGVSSATTTASGTVELNAFTQTATSATLTKGDYTPEGTVTINGSGATVKVLDTQGSVTTGTAATYTQGEDEFDAGSLPSIDTTKFDGGSLSSVEISAPDVQVGYETIQEPVPVYTGNSFSAGTLPTKASDTFTAGSYTQGSDSFTAATLGSATKGSFAIEGVVASIDSEDTECLVFTAASTSSAVIEQGAFNGGSFTQGTDSFTAPTFTEGAFTQGTLPSFNEGSYYVYASEIMDNVTLSASYDGNFSASVDFTPASINTGFFDAGALPTFSQGSDTFNGGSVTQVTLPTFKDATVLTDASATFTGTTAESILVTGVSYDKATANGATFTGSASDVTVTLSTTSKTVDVNPKTSA